MSKLKFETEHFFPLKQFIDPLVDIFVDPCHSEYKTPASIEILKFKQYTDKYFILFFLFYFIDIFSKYVCHFEFVFQKEFEYNLRFFEIQKLKLNQSY